MNNQVVMQVMQFAAPYKGSFIKSMEELDRNITSCGGTMIWVFPEKCKATAWIDEFVNKYKGKVYFVSEPKRKFKFFCHGSLVGELEKLINLHKPTVVHSHFDGYDEFCALAIKKSKSNAKHIIHCRNAHEPAVTFRDKIHKKIRNTLQYRFHCKKSLAIVLNNSFESELRKMGFKGKVIVCPNGIDESRVDYKNHSLKVSDKYKFLMFGGRGFTKGLDTVLEAVKILHNKYTEKYELNVTKSKDTSNFIKDKEFKLEDYPELKLIDARENVSELFAESDCFISASRGETFSNAIAEAMLGGLPIISSNIEGVSWAIGQKSVTLFEKENSQELATEMEKYINGERTFTQEELILSREYLLANYTVDIWATKMVDIYKKELGV